MAAISAALVKELRERTGLGMMECKKALVEAQGDIEVAIEEMRKSGQAKAAKKAGRIAAEGIVAVKVADNASFGYWLKLTVKLTSLPVTITSWVTCKKSLMLLFPVRKSMLLL